MHTATRKNNNIKEKGSGEDKKAQCFVEGFVASSRHRKKIHPYQTSKIKAYITQGSGAGSKEKV